MSENQLVITNEIHQMQDISINGVTMTLWTRNDGTLEISIHDKEKTIKSIDLFGNHKDMKLTKNTKHFPGLVHDFSVMKLERV